MKNNYAKITYTNCDSVEYDYTICHWNEVQDNLFVAKDDLEDFNRKEFDKNNDAYPSVKIEPVFMSVKDYEKWFIENVEKNA